jgi:hypothetical protein
VKPLSIFQVEVDGLLPPAKSQRSIFGPLSNQHKRLRALLEEVHRVKSAGGLGEFGSAPIRMEVEVRAPAGSVPGDATNYLGGIADALEMKKRRRKASGPLDHLGYRQHVGLYQDDRQLKEVFYRETEADRMGYTVRLELLTDGPRSPGVS